MTTKASICRVTIRPGFPGHVLSFWASFWTSGQALKNWRFVRFLPQPINMPYYPECYDRTYVTTSIQLIKPFTVIYHCEWLT